MRLVRFDEEVAFPVDGFGSRLRVGPLTGNDARVRVQVMHLPPRGVVGRHAAAAQQLFAVIAGRGRVSGHDGKSEALGPGYAAVWDAGEYHDASSEEGLTAESVKLVSDEELPHHHLYVVVENNKAHLDHWLLRDLLRDDVEARERYAALKRRNARLADRNMDVYVAGKAAFVAELLTRARAERGLPPATYWVPDVDLS